MFSEENAHWYTLSGNTHQSLHSLSGCHIKIPDRDLKQQKIISHRLESGKSKIKMPADLLPGEDSLPGLHTAAFFLNLTSFPPCSHGEREIEHAGISSHQETNPIKSGPTLTTSFINYFCKGPISKLSTLGVRVSTQECGGRNTYLQSITWSCMYLCLYMYIHSKSSKYYKVLSDGFLSNLPIFMNMSTSRYGLFSF